MIKNIFSLICFLIVSSITVIIYSNFNNLNYIYGLKVFLLLLVIEMSFILYLYLKNRKKDNYIILKDETIIIVKNNRKVEYKFSQAEVFTFVPNCFENIRFNKNISISSIHFRNKDFKKIKNKVVSNLPNKNQVPKISIFNRVDCKKILPIYKLLTLSIILLIILYLPVFGIVGKVLIIFIIIFFFESIYDANNNYLKNGCLYITFFIFIIVLLSLYQIIFGNSTNWLGTGFDLTTLPKIDL